MFFNHKREDASAIRAFQRSSVKTGLALRYSALALDALRHIKQSELDGTEPTITEWQAVLLLRYGLIRPNNGGYVTTQIAPHVLALAEAGGLVTFRAKVAPIKRTKESE